MNYIGIDIHMQTITEPDFIQLNSQQSYTFELSSFWGQATLIGIGVSSLEHELDPEHFLRIHRSTIVQKAQIAELTTLEPEGFLIRLRNGSEVKASGGYRLRLGKWL